MEAQRTWLLGKPGWFMLDLQHELETRGERFAFAMNGNWRIRRGAESVEWAMFPDETSCPLTQITHTLWCDLPIWVGDGWKRLSPLAAGTILWAEANPKKAAKLRRCIAAMQPA